MFQNLKVDVIYYKTNTDFEMEFNLCGCCRMRLLTDKSPDRKTMVHSLARAVSRSRVIIIVGNLFGADGIIKLAAGAIGSTVVSTDNKAYGIAGEQNIEIINGSVPLVTPEGYFGGCIIESGPQTLILLSENKNIRKSVMKTLIHPYIEELCAIELKEKAETATVTATEEKNEDAAEPIENLPEEPEEIPQKEAVSEEAVIEPQNEENSPEEEPEIDLIVDSDEEEAEDGAEAEINNLIVDSGDEDGEIEMVSSTDASDSEDDGMFVESDIIFEDNTISMRDFIRRNEEYYNEQETVRGLLTDDEDFYPQKRGALNLPILIIAVLLLVLLIVLCYCIFYIPSKDGVSASLYINEIFNTLFG